MTTAQKPEPGTDVALTRDSVGVLPPEVRNAIALRKMQNQVASQLASMNWGKALDLDTRRALADWGQTMGVDVSTEIDVLGSNIYLNSRFYLRKLGELIASGVVEYAYADHVEHDDRLTTLGAEGEGEASRRLRERLMYRLDDKAVSAVVFRVKLRNMEREVTGAKQCGTGKKTSYGKLADPVGEEFPTETSESRAARRCMRLLVTHVPPHMGQQLDQIERTAETIESRIVHARNELKESNARIDAPPPGRSRVPAGSMPALNPGDAYSEIDTSRTKEMETVGREAPVRVVEAETATQGRTREIDEELGARARAAADIPHASDSFLCTLGDWRGHPLREIPTAALVLAHDIGATSGKRYEPFVAAAADVLEARRLGDLREPTDEEVDAAIAARDKDN